MQNKDLFPGNPPKIPKELEDTQRIIFFLIVPDEKGDVTKGNRYKVGNVTTPAPASNPSDH